MVSCESTGGSLNDKYKNTNSCFQKDTVVYAGDGDGV